MQGPPTGLPPGSEGSKVQGSNAEETHGAHEATKHASDEIAVDGGWENGALSKKNGEINKILYIYIYIV